MDDRATRELLAVLAQRIKERRRVLGITQEQLAERSGLSTNFIARLELCMKTPSITTLARLARALEVRVPDLLTGEAEEEWIGAAQDIANSLATLDPADAELVVRQMRGLIEHFKH
ncbi:MAG: helix-turn-helix domain-containing protein [Armatimonadota bacterium]